MSIEEKLITIIHNYPAIFTHGANKEEKTKSFVEISKKFQGFKITRKTYYYFVFVEFDVMNINFSSSTGGAVGFNPF